MDNWPVAADELGPLKVLHIHEPAAGLRAIVVVDNVAVGPAVGGIRMAPDVTVSECARLARAMTLKNAAAGLPHGGGKAVIIGDPKMAAGDKERVIRCFACAIENEIEYIPGPDMGTDEACMAWIHDEIGRVVGLPSEIGGIPLDEIGATGYGLAEAVEVALPHCDFELEGARVVVQGFGAVGSHAARFLGAKGTVLVAAADSRGAIRLDTGLDVEMLVELKREGGTVADYPGGTPIEQTALVEVPCEIWIPAARPDVIDESNVDRLNTKLVPQGANIPFTSAAEASLAARGVVVIPDFIANAGGVICAAVEYAGGTETQAFDVIGDKIRSNTAEVLEAARSDGVIPRAAAEALARRRVEVAMGSRRWGVF